LNTSFYQDPGVGVGVDVDVSRRAATAVVPWCDTIGAFKG
jgi:hypothetical protein